MKGMRANANGGEMLSQFKVSGFKNFDHELILDFTDVRDYKFNSYCITNNFLSKIIVYGKNASGKSNLGLAMFDIVSHLTNKNITPGVYDYYLNASKERAFAEFEYIFNFGNKSVTYMYRKNHKRALVYEKVLVNEELVFDYNYEEKKGNLEPLRKMAPTLNWKFNDVESILKYVLNNTVFDGQHPLKQMMEYVSKMLWYRSLDENRYIGYKERSADYLDFISEEKTLRELEHFFLEAGIKEKLILKKDADGINRLYFDTPQPLPFFKTASNGTQALYTFFYWYKTAKDVSLLFIDEFDAYYHYDLAETIVKLLEKLSNTQIMLTSHNTKLLNNRIMRPDCYLILSNGKLTSIANATERELREGHNLEKLYISGEFYE